MGMPSPVACCLSLAALSLACSFSAAAGTAAPVIIAEGGSTCILPDETLAAFQAAIDDGANFLSMHVVATKDGELVVRPDVTLDGNTNVRNLRQFNQYRTVTNIGNGRKKTGVFVADLTLDQVKQLYAVQTFKFRDISYNSRYRVPTLKEVLDLVNSDANKAKKVGVAIHTKEPGYYNELGSDLVPRIMRVLNEGGFDASNFADRVKLQSYHMPVLEEFRAEMDKAGIPPKASLVLLVACTGRVPIISDEVLDEFARIGHALAPEKELLEDLTYAEECGSIISPPCWKTGQFCTGKLAEPYTRGLTAKATPLLSRAHNRSLAVYPYVFRNEGRYMAVDFAADLQQELDYFAGPLGMGVDGLYVDCTRTSSEWMLARHVQLKTPTSKVAAAAAATVAAGKAAAARAADAASTRIKTPRPGNTVPTWVFALVVVSLALASVLAVILVLRNSR
eukprot:CAMPEP_0206145956 /NCGR_PEP_ID=MMETSP1473-20131121/29054_1 /ASSEMBLY_ACC=CAM_ASM_001109 /TAXON_ID=1461547 /ORGANISM="Stichococcus sp, Strain RCC1054" /LENGTH=449 /DNA_ID=CAMNT_0053542359 /DNA_START=124 /DNA_END=1469 /DNA_ORIENTATION=-